MVTRASSVRYGAQAGRAFPFVLSSGQMEVCKWLAFACMVVSHTYRHVYGGSEGWPVDLGRLCFPIFAVCVALPLSQAPVERGQRLAFSLFFYAVVAQLIAQPIRDGSALNVLFLFLSAGAWLASDGLRPGERLVVRGLALLVAFLAEFSLPGLAFVVMLVRAFRLRSWGWLMGAWAMFWLVSAFEGNFWGLLAVVVLGLAEAVPVGFRPVRRLFPRLYVSQYVAFWVARAFS